MIINHINLTVTDVGATVDFLETYFGLRRQDGDEKFTVLFDDNDMVVSLMKGGQAKYPPTFHIGFIQDSDEQVNKIYQQLKADGYNVTAPERHHAWTFYVTAPGGFMIEVLS